MYNCREGERGGGEMVWNMKSPNHQEEEEEEEEDRRLRCRLNVSSTHTSEDRAQHQPWTGLGIVTYSLHFFFSFCFGPVRTIVAVVVAVAPAAAGCIPSPSLQIAFSRHHQFILSSLPSSFWITRAAAVVAISNVTSMSQNQLDLQISFCCCVIKEWWRTVPFCTQWRRRRRMPY